MSKAETANKKHAREIRAESGKKNVGGTEVLDSSMKLSSRLRSIPQDSLKLAKHPHFTYPHSQQPSQ